MMRKVMISLLVMGFAAWASGDYSVTEIDFLEKSGLDFNGAGPLLMQVDQARNRLVTVNTLSSSVSVIDCATRTPYSTASLPEHRKTQFPRSNPNRPRIVEAACSTIALE